MFIEGKQGIDIDSAINLYGYISSTYFDKLKDADEIGEIEGVVEYNIFYAKS